MRQTAVNKNARSVLLRTHTHTASRRERTTTHSHSERNNGPENWFQTCNNKNHDCCFFIVTL